jgi:hypothetical protein
VAARSIRNRIRDGLQVARLEKLRSPEDFRVTIDRVAIAGQFKSEQKKNWKIRVELPARSR